MSNSIGFEHFKLHSDSTLKSLTKDELIKYIHMVYHNWKATDETYCNTVKHAQDLDEQLNYACSILANICTELANICTELSECSEITCPHRCKNMPCNNECNTVNGWRKRIEEEVKRIG